MSSFFMTVPFQRGSFASGRKWSLQISEYECAGFNGMVLNA